MAGSPHNTAGDGGRFGAIDLLKAVATLVVVAIHASRIAPQDELTRLELGLSRAFHFAVPAFLFCSGFLLQASGPLPWATTRRRLRRILQPYLLASALALAYRAAIGQPVRPLRDLLLFNAFGPYYYVFLIVSLIAIAPALGRLPDGPRRLFVLAFLELGAALGGVHGLAPILPWLNLLTPVAMVLWCGRDPHARRAAIWLGVFWWSLWLGFVAIHFYRAPFAQGVPLHLRNPGFNWGYFLLGWELRHLYRDDRMRAWLERHRHLAAWVSTGAAIALLVRGFQTPPGMFAWPAWPYSVCVTVGLFALFWDAHWAASAPVAWLSDASYTVYLFHLFVILPVRQAFSAHGGDWTLISGAGAGLWAAGLALPLGLAAVARRWPVLLPWVGSRRGTRAANLGT